VSCHFFFDRVDLASTLERRVPESDPTRATAFGYTRSAAAGAAGISLRVQMGTQPIELLADRDGRLLSANLVHSEGGI